VFGPAVRIANRKLTRHTQTFCAGPSSCLTDMSFKPLLERVLAHQDSSFSTLATTSLKSSFGSPSMSFASFSSVAKSFPVRPYHGHSPANFAMPCHILPSAINQLSTQLNLIFPFNILDIGCFTQRRDEFVHSEFERQNVEILVCCLCWLGQRRNGRL
jgi:hypothetical protein